MQKKCEFDKTSKHPFDGDFDMPWNVNPVFGGQLPEATNAQWHGKDYSQGSILSVEEQIKAWDGCRPIESQTKV